VNVYAIHFDHMKCSWNVDCLGKPVGSGHCVLLEGSKGIEPSIPDAGGLHVDQDMPCCKMAHSLCTRLIRVHSNCASLAELERKSPL
jgi:hypothetical protein